MKIPLSCKKKSAPRNATCVQLQEVKSLFASFSSEKEDSVLFLKKKNQKDFYFPVTVPRGAVHAAAMMVHFLRESGAPGQTKSS